MKRVQYIIAAVALALGLAVGAGCSEWNDERGIGDYPAHQMPDEVRTVFGNADRYANVSAFCIGETGIYTTTGNQRDAMDPVPNDPNCAPGGILAKEREANAGTG